MLKRWSRVHAFDEVNHDDKHQQGEINALEDPDIQIRRYSISSWGASAMDKAEKQQAGHDKR